MAKITLDEQDKKQGQAQLIKSSSPQQLKSKTPSKKKKEPELPRGNISWNDALMAALPALAGGVLFGESGLEGGLKGSQAMIQGQLDRQEADAATEQAEAKERRMKEHDFALLEKKQKHAMELEQLKQKNLMAKKAASGKQKLSDTEQKNAIFGARMQQAQIQFEDLRGKGYKREDAAEAAGTILPNWARSSESQQHEQAKRNFLTAVLRRESGAKISEDEMESAEKQYFPAFGDSEDTIEQKRRNRELAKDLMLAGAGPAQILAQTRAAELSGSTPEAPKAISERDELTRLRTKFRR